MFMFVFYVCYFKPLGLVWFVLQEQYSLQIQGEGIDKGQK